MEPAVARRTQESLGKVIRKPPLTDKLLGKPPFRYLHDILTEVIRTNGFLKGLYTESELKSDNVKDKDAKISFLQKAIDVVVLVTGEPLAVKPARVVAGHEPEKTNEFLQAIGKCCLNKLSSDDAVKRILSGEKVDLKSKPPSSSKSQDKENREAKDEERRSSREKEDRRESEIHERSGSRDKIERQQLKEEDRKQSERERKKEREKVGETERDGLREGEKNEKEKNKVRESRSETDKNRSKDKSEHERGREKERRNDGSHGKEKDRTRDKERVREKDQEKDRETEDPTRDREKDHRERNRGRDQEKSQTRDPDKERRRERDPERARRKERRDNESKPGREDKPQEEERTERKHKTLEESTKKASDVSVKENKSATDKEPSLPSRSARPSASKLRERKPAKLSGEGSVQQYSKLRQQNFKSKGGRNKVRAAESVTTTKPGRELEIRPKPRLVRTMIGESASDDEGGTAEVPNSENNDISDAQKNISAQRRIPRPGSARPAPPRVKRQGSAEVVIPERVASGKALSSVIVDKQKVDADDDDDEFVVEEASPQVSVMPLDQELDLLGDEKHGSLVKKILETKKDYETQPDAASKDKMTLSDTGRRKEKDMVTREIEKLRSSIQIVCRSALPLGKIMDYIQEDMDTMKNELQTWRRENHEHAEVLLREQSITDSAVEPLKAELAELEQLIKEQRDKICTVKGNILRNDEKIQKMAQTISVSNRE